MIWRSFIRYLLFPFLIIFTFCGLAGSQAIPSLSPPAWSVGDWWTVQCQVYDLGKIVKGSQPGWRPSQAWRFQVDKIEPLADQDYYVVSITPLQDNSCPYSFRYWFRVSDRFIGRQELINPTPIPSKPKKIGPPTVTRDFFNGPAAPFLTDEFPTLPVSMPLFNVTRESMAFAPGSGEQRSQKIEEVSLPALMQKANPELLAKSEKSLSQRNLRITLDKASNVSESQYWNTGLPFPVYGERFDQTYTSRRYWLVEVGKK
jgi:hypothetical protein